MNRMGNPVETPDERFTYRHYRTWPDSERWELIDGHAWAMSPAPLRSHQKLSMRLSGWINSFLEGKPCEAYAAPFDVLLPESDEADDEIETVVQPDIVVICDKSKLTRAGARGAPDLVVEILSPSTSKKDQREKFELYQKRGVREYWVIDPAGEWLCVYRLIQGRGREGGRLKDAAPCFDEGELRERGREYGPISSHVLEGFTVDPARLFADLD
ncbi:MAG: Uma2 family endonuclease [Rectinemataceae bacterium]